MKALAFAAKALCGKAIATFRVYSGKMDTAINDPLVARSL
jgi:hypothetical protein